MNRLFLFCLLALAGCQVARFSPSDPHAKTLLGQMHYIGVKRSFVGDFTARVSANDFQLDISKGPGVTLLSIHESGGTLAHFEGAGHSWTGNPQRFVPRQLRGWLALHEVFRDVPRADMRVSRANGLLNAEFLPSHERFAFQINR